jgi:hypothetical protein
VPLARILVASTRPADFGRVRADVVAEVGVRPDGALRRDTAARYAALRAAVSGSPVD